jgi:hypothetical protein
VIRALMLVLGALVTAVLIAAVARDPHLWGQLIAALDHQARTRIITPRRTP